MLSRWPIVETVKILLPHASPATHERRIAVGAWLDVGGESLAVYSVRAELPILPDSKCREQKSHLAEAVAGEKAACTIVGGDFNTPTASSVAMADEAMGTVGLEPVSGNRSPTLQLGVLGFTLDHFYSTGVAPLSAGVVTPSRT